MVDCAHWLRNRHVVVVQDDEQVRAFGIVERLERHARAHRAVADDCDDVTLRAAKLRRRRHSERCRDRRGRMCRSERVVRRFVTPREARGSTPLPQLAHLRAAARQYLVRVRLMPDVPHDAIARRIENVMERNRQFDGAEIRRQMPAGLRHRVQHERTKLARKLRQLRPRQTTKLRGIIDRFEQRKDRHGSKLSVYDPVGYLAKAPCTIAEWHERVARVGAKRFGALLCGRQAQ